MKKIAVSFLLIVLLFLSAGCGKKTNENEIVIWHQMRVEERLVMEEQARKFEAQHPGVKINMIFKETEELRSGYIIAALGGEGPDLVYCPSDNVGPFAEMRIIKPLKEIFDTTYFSRFTPRAVVSFDTIPYLIADKLGNHLTLVYNKKFVKTPPVTETDLIALGKSLTVDENGDGKTDRYGLVWNYTEPFFFIPFFTGYGGWVLDKNNNPTLNSDAMVKALRFMAELKFVHRIIPQQTDYDQAETLFKEGRAAMIINGDWSWAAYGRAGIDYGITPLPIISETGLRAAPMVASKGFVFNKNITNSKLPIIKSLVEYFLLPENQMQSALTVKTIPTDTTVINNPLVAQDSVLRNSLLQAEYGKPQPIVTEMRVIWDAMRPYYQEVLGKSEMPSDADLKAAADQMQENTVRIIAQLREEREPGIFGIIMQFVMLFAVLGLLFWGRKSFLLFFRNLKKDAFAYALALPALFIMLAVIIYPFVYNIILSFSNMNLAYMDNWSIIGVQQYGKVFTEPRFYEIFFKTLVWTFVNIFFHVTVGVGLALLLNRDLPGKSIFRTLLILPWAIPQYIVALTWRGMFNYEYGAVNLSMGSIFGIPPINWLSSPLETFIAVITTNVWLGFPFMMIIALGALQSIPKELYEAADIDGAKWYHKLKTITLPLIKPVMMPAIVLGTVWTFNALNVVWLVSNAGEPSDKTHILVSYVYKAAFNRYDFAYAAAFSMVIFLMLVIFNVTVLKKSRASESIY